MLKTPNSEKLDLYAEATLAPDITFSNPHSTAPNLFLTGASGFVGAYLLETLLRTTDKNIYCLVRKTDETTGYDRLKHNLIHYELWSPAYATRIIPVIGDLLQPLFGLTPADFQNLAEHIGVIYHNGAMVNAARPYSTLKIPNVNGTQEILRLAGFLTTKPVHFISSLAVFFNSSANATTCLRETDLPDGTTLQGGYRQSKWVAEQLIRHAQTRGLPATIYRLGRIMGHSQTGINGNLNDLLCLILKGCLTLGIYPDTDTSLNFAPVDYISNSLIYLSKQPDSAGKTYHLLHPESIGWLHLIELIKTLSYPLKPTDYPTWQATLREHSQQIPKQDFFAVLSLTLRNSAFFAEKPSFDSQLTQNALAKSGFTCPIIDKTLLKAYFTYFERCGFLPPNPLT